jgi:glyoxylase I family protein
VITLRGIDHVVLRVRDMAEMTRFYRDVLGAQLVAWRPELGLAHLRAGSAMIDLLLTKSEVVQEKSAMDHLCLRVEPFDAEAIRNHLASHGVNAGELRERFGAEGTGPSLYLIDPEGNQVELKGPSDGASLPRKGTA